MQRSRVVIATACLVGSMLLNGYSTPVNAENMSSAPEQKEIENIFCLPSRNSITREEAHGFMQELFYLPEKACIAYRTGVLSAQEYSTLLQWLPSLTVAYSALDGLGGARFANLGDDAAASIHMLIRESPAYGLLCVLTGKTAEHTLNSQHICTNLMVSPHSNIENHRIN